MCNDSDCYRDSENTRVNELITKHKDQPGWVLNFFREYMEKYGGLSCEIIKRAAEAFDMEETEIEDLLYSCNILPRKTNIF